MKSVLELTGTVTNVLMCRPSVHMMACLMEARLRGADAAFEMVQQSRPDARVGARGYPWGDITYDEAMHRAARKLDTLCDTTLPVGTLGRAKVDRAKVVATLVDAANYSMIAADIRTEGQLTRGGLLR